jgi:predicted DNA-binding transcriptional regulator AlpA
VGSTRTDNDASPFVRFQAVCELLGIHYNTGYTLRREGTFPIPVIAIGGRYYCRRHDVDTFTDGEPA